VITCELLTRIFYPANIYLGGLLILPAFTQADYLSCQHLLRRITYPACARFRRRRSRSDNPPQIPKRSSFSSAYSRQSTFTSHELQTRFASRVEPPFSGKKASGSVWAQSARSCQPRSSVSVKGSRANSLTWNLLVSRNEFAAALMQATNPCVTRSDNRTCS